jgi:hypothetical protein
MAKAEAQLEVHPLYRLKAEAQSLKQEADSIKQRSFVIDEAQKSLAKDIADMEAAQTEAKAIVSDYQKKEPNLRILHGELKSFADVETDALRRELKASAARLTGARDDVNKDIEEAQKNVNSLSDASNGKNPDKSREKAEKRRTELVTAQEEFDTARAAAKAHAVSLDALKALRDRIAASSDTGEKFILALEINDRLKDPLPGHKSLEGTLFAALHKLLAAKSEYHNAARKAKDDEAGAADLRESLAKKQANRLEKLVATAKGLNVANTAAEAAAAEGAATPPPPGRELEKKEDPKKP